jgi:hypothetical protein
MPVAMQHPDVDAPATAIDEDQFLTVWRPRGWERQAPPEAFASEQLGKLVRTVDDLTIDELIQLGALRQTGEIPKSAKKAEHLAAYKATFDESPVEEPPTEVQAPDVEVGAEEKTATPAVSSNPDNPF